MTLPSFRQNGVWLARVVLRPRFSHIRHKFIPTRVHLLIGRNQQGFSFPSPQNPETLPLFHPVQKSAGLLV